MDAGMEFSAVVEEVQRATGLSPGLAHEVAQRHVARVQGVSERYNAWLLGRLVMWLTDGERTKLSVAALPLALGMKSWFFEGRKIASLEEQSVALRISVDDLRAEVDRARVQLRGDL
jgi:hypothetical protein